MAGFQVAINGRFYGRGCQEKQFAADLPPGPEPISGQPANTSVVPCSHADAEELDCGREHSVQPDTEKRHAVIIADQGSI
jgi:hypothetical protein